jgi:hypothetical protein
VTTAFSSSTDSIFGMTTAWAPLVAAAARSFCAPGGGEGVAADGDLAVAVVAARRGGAGVGSGGVFGVGGDGVLEVEDEGVGGDGAGFVEGALVGRWHVEDAAAGSQVAHGAA